MLFKNHFWIQGMKQTSRIVNVAPMGPWTFTNAGHPFSVQVWKGYANQFNLSWSGQQMEITLSDYGAKRSPTFSERFVN